jgi:hypothetical protein
MSKLSNRSYFVHICSLLEEFNSDLISLNDKYIKKITKIQKSVLNPEQTKQFVADFLQKADKISANIQYLRDQEIDQLKGSQRPLDKLINDSLAVLKNTFSSNNSYISNSLVKSKEDPHPTEQKYYNDIRVVGYILDSNFTQQHS